MAQDEGDDQRRQALARHYYVHAWQLADEAGEPELAATVLRGLTVQAIGRGPRHRADAVALAETTMNYAAHLDDPRAVAYYQTTLADAAALDGDHRTATPALSASQTNIDELQGGRLYDRAAVVASAMENYDRLRAHALPPDDSVALIKTLAKEYTS